MVLLTVFYEVIYIRTAAPNRLFICGLGTGSKPHSAIKKARGESVKNSLTTSRVI